MGQPRKRKIKNFECNMNLFTPGYIGNLKLNNRVLMSPMNVGGNNDTDGCLSIRGINYYVERARGGVGMIVTGATRVTRKFERDTQTIPLWMLFADHMVHGKWISELAERCHDYDTKVCVQLTAGGGRIAGAYAQNHGLAISASSTPCFYPPYLLTREMTKEDIKIFTQAFEQAARLIKNAGADAIQIHGHQGYLIDQFTTSLWNHRTDEYGGSLENRLRFPKELIEAIKRGAGESFPVIYRYGLTHYIEGGRTIEEGVEMGKLLESYGADALDIDSGCYENNYYPHPPSTIPCGSFSYLSEKVKKAVSIPVISSTRIGYPEIAEKIIESGQADFVSLGRPLIADPEWCSKAKIGHIQEIRPCIACHEGCLRRLKTYKRVSCAVNPAAGDEDYLKVEKSDKTKKIAVIGGGVAGMVAAIVSSKRGHIVTLFEKDEELGGNFKKNYIPHFKSDYKHYVDYLKYELDKSNVKVQLKTTIDFTILQSDYDSIINACGANFKTLNIKGLDKHRVLNPFALYEDKSYKNQEVIIVGGGLVGVEAALNIAEHGGHPIIIEKFGDLAKTAHPVNKRHLEILLEQNSIKVYKNTEILYAEGNKLFCLSDNVHISLSFDTISICVGLTSRRLGIEDSERVITVGDADHPENVMSAVWQAYRRCRLI